MSAEDIGRSIGRLWVQIGTPGKLLFLCAITMLLTLCSGAFSVTEGPPVRPAVAIKQEPPKDAQPLHVEYASPELRAAAESPPKETPPEVLRELLSTDLLQRVQKANSHLNHIKKRIRKIKGGYELMIVHDFFTRYTFSSGRTDRVFQEWIRNNEDTLKKAGITKVGVMGTGEYASGAWFDLK